MLPSVSLALRLVLDLNSEKMPYSCLKADTLAAMRKLRHKYEAVLVCVQLAGSKVSREFCSLWFDETYLNLQ